MPTNAHDIADPLEGVYEKIRAVREHRADLVERVRSGSLDLDAVFAASEQDPVIADTKILGLVESLPDIGKVQTRRALESVGIAESARIVEVTPDQRCELTAVLSGADR